MVQNLIKEHSGCMLSYLDKSLNLNPIKHFWRKLKKLVCELHFELETMDLVSALKQALHYAMAVINGFEQWDLPAKLIASMPKRRAAVRLVEESRFNTMLDRAD